MRKIKPKVVIFNPPTEQELIDRIIVPLRNCYRSFDLSESSKDKKLIENAALLGHTSVEEHCVIQLVEIMNRGTHTENIRHRIGISRSAESTRYADYTKDKHGSQITFIDPMFFQNDPEAYAVWEQAMIQAEAAYKLLREKGYAPQVAREVLPMSLKITEVQTYNFTSLKHRFSQRIGSNVHPEFRRITLPELKWFGTTYPTFFGHMYAEAELIFGEFESKYGAECYADIQVHNGPVDVPNLLDII